MFFFWYQLTWVVADNGLLNGYCWFMFWLECCVRYASTTCCMGRRRHYVFDHSIHLCMCAWQRHSLTTLPLTSSWHRHSNIVLMFIRSVRMFSLYCGIVEHSYTYIRSSWNYSGVMCAILACKCHQAAAESAPYFHRTDNQSSADSVS